MKTNQILKTHQQKLKWLHGIPLEKPYLIGCSNLRGFSLLYLGPGQNVSDIFFFSKKKKHNITISQIISYRVYVTALPRDFRMVACDGEVFRGELGARG